MNKPDEFSALISKWQDAYTFAVFSYVGVRTPKGNHLFCGRILFELTRPAIGEAPFTFETEYIIAGRFAKKITANDVTTAVAKAKIGRIDGFDEVVSLAAMESRQYDEYLHPVTHPFTSNLKISGASRHSLLQTMNYPELDSHLKAAHIPFDTLNELLIHCGLSALTQADQSYLELVAKSPGIIGIDSTIIEGKASIKIETGKMLNYEKFRVGYSSFQEKKKQHTASVKGDALEWREENNLMVTAHSVQLGEASSVEVFLSYDGIHLDQRVITNPKQQLNLRHEIYQISDPNLKHLKKILLKPEKESQTFERAVSILFNLLGFSAMHYGLIPKLQDGVDIIVFTPSNNIVVVECTIGLLNENNKLAKLVKRTKSIRDTLVEGGDNSSQVQSIIVTPLPRGAIIKADLKIAGDDNIAVICKEELEDALNQVASLPAPEEFFQGLKRLIPASDSDSPFGNSLFR